VNRPITSADHERCFWRFAAMLHSRPHRVPAWGDNEVPGEYAPLLLLPFTCANCGHDLRQPRIYCSSLCRLGVSRNCHFATLRDVRGRDFAKSDTPMSGGYPSSLRRPSFKILDIFTLIRSGKRLIETKSADGAGDLGTAPGESRRGGL
jgi:hypothetical protein